MTRLQAHRGVSSEFPENTISAFAAAVDEGYDLIELDTKFTKDNRCVVLHDRTVNRTGRTPDGGLLPENTAIADVTLAQAREWDFGLSKGGQFRGEKIPTLGETLAFAAAHDIPFKFDNVWESFTDVQRGIFFSELEAADLGCKLGITCRKLENLAAAAARFPEAELHWDGGSERETLDAVKAAAGAHRLVIWVCYDNDKSKWYKGPRATPELCDFVRGYGEVGTWILTGESELEDAVLRLHADAVETTGHIKPSMLAKFRA